MKSFVEDLGRFQTANEKLIQIVAEAHRIAVTLNPVLILGEPGTGRRELALEIFEKSTRSHGRFLRWSQEKNFLNTDTIVVEDVDSLSEDQQFELFEAVSQTLTKNPMNGPRWIATGCRDLMSKIRQGHFLVRLFQVFSTHTLTMPSLHERLDDVAHLAQNQVKNWNTITGQAKELSAESLRQLLKRNYSRNVAELNEIIEKSYFVTAGKTIDLVFNESATQIAQAGLTLSEMERRLILQTLQITNQNRTKAAEILGISIRTLRNKLNEYREAGVQI